MGYFKRLIKHPGFDIAVVMTILSFFAGATNKSANWWVGGLFGLLICVIFVWSILLITNIEKNPKRPYKHKSRKMAKKLSLLHYIETDKAKYHIYNIECLEDTNVSLWIERDGKAILQEEIFEESWGTLGADSFTTFVLSCKSIAF